MIYSMRNTYKNSSIFLIEMLIRHNLKDMLASHNFGGNNEMDATLKFPNNITKLPLKYNLFYPDSSLIQKFLKTERQQHSKSDTNLQKHTEVRIWTPLNIEFDIA